MEQTNVEKIFTWFDEATELIQQELNLTYLDSLAIAGETLYIEQMNTEFSDVLKQKLKKKLSNINLNKLSNEELRKGFQLAVLKGMKEATQQQHLITPDTVAMFIGYLVQKLMKAKDAFALFDPAYGTGNLVNAVLNQLKHKEIKAFGSEVDPTLIELGYVNANLQKQNIEIFHQDSLRPFLLEPVDLVLADLPVGYYPDDVQASSYKLKAEKGHSYAHHLFIEQSLNYVKEKGYLVFVIPNFLFESDQADKLNAFLHEHAHIVGLMQLPLTMFKSEKQAKSIFILQKKGKDTKAPKEALLAQLPSFSNANAMNDILDKINNWFSNEFSS